MHGACSYQYSMPHRSNARWRERFPMYGYVAAALLSVEYDVESDGHTYASHPLLPGITASGDTFVACRKRFRQVLEARLERAAETGESFPIINGVAPPVHARSVCGPILGDHTGSASTCSSLVGIAHS